MANFNNYVGKHFRLKRLTLTMKNLLRSISKFVEQLSTKPHYESYTWGGEQSLLALIFYQSVYFARFLSPLQWYKTIWRKSNVAKAARDGKERTDFHALHSELYLLYILSFALCAYFLNDGLSAYFLIFHADKLELFIFIKTFIMGWLLVESILWTLYYMLLRILIEKRLSIFNEAEYFIVLPVVLFTQIVLLSDALNADLSDVTTALFNLSYSQTQLSGAAHVAIGMLGYVYTVLIIANIINLIPALPVRRRPNITIIGAGDVVENRILPALIKNNFYKTSQVSVASDRISADFKAYLKRHKISYFEARSPHDKKELSFSQRNKIRQDISNFVAKRSSYAIIATPTEEHFPYMTALAKKEITFAIEKPIVGNIAELQAIQAYGKEIMSRGFLLSYYWLEKALPLNYFLTLNANYRDFLDVQAGDDSTSFISQNTLAYIRQRLGKPKHVRISFFEDQDSRQWALLKETGGFYYETFIHPITLLYHVLGKDLSISSMELDWYTTEGALEFFDEQKQALGANFIHLKSTTGECKIDIRAGKFTGQKKRQMLIEYDSGHINVDLDNMSCNICWTGDEQYASTTIKIKEEHIKPYDTQMRLFDLFVNEAGTWNGQRFDDFPSQHEVLQKMLTILDLGTDNNSFYHPKLLSVEELERLIE